MKSKKLQAVTLIFLLALLGTLLLKHQAFSDWLRLRGYSPPVAVATLAADDTMTGKARRLFYVNHPDITNGTIFSSHCPAGGEKTVVLGCYVGNDAGIYIYKISDNRLNGVEQVTAAHETLHAAYRRLSSSERNKVDKMLMDYYEHGLSDQRIKDTIAAYKKSEPNDVVNEMHSVFGTEVPNLPAPLEQYYKQYFSDRAKITAYTASYENEFTSRQQQVARYDAELQSMKQQIKTDQTLIENDLAILNTEKSQLDSERSSGQAMAYNAEVPIYNHAVNAYNDLLTKTKNEINQYNSIVDERNAVALEEQQLAQELSSSSLPQSK